MPYEGGERNDNVLLASISALFEPVEQPADANEKWRRPTELMWRAWCLLEELPADERADPSSKLLPGGARVLKAFRAQFGHQLAAGGTVGDIANRILADLVPVSKPDGCLNFAGGQTVTVDAFKLGATAVTREQFALFDSAYLEVHRDSIESYAYRSGDCPAGQIDWYDAWVGSRYFGCRLATEAEWQHACSAGATTDLCRIATAGEPFYRDLSTNDELLLVADYGRDWGEGPKPVRSGLRENLFGLIGMLGGVWEWCGNLAPDNASANSRMNGREGRTHRVLRGGAWSFAAANCRNSYRLASTPSFRSDVNGFRLAQDASDASRTSPDPDASTRR
jgi:Sulfatase-modifying factor enzyme 1